MSKRLGAIAGVLAMALILAHGMVLFLEGNRKTFRYKKQYAEIEASIGEPDAIVMMDGKAVAAQYGDWKTEPFPPGSKVERVFKSDSGYPAAKKKFIERHMPKQ